MRAIALVALALLLGACNEENPDPPAQAVVVSLRTLDSFGQPGTSFLQGEVITVELALDNAGPTDLRLSFPSGQQFDLVLRQSDSAELWRWSSDKLFTQAVTHLQLAAGERHTDAVAWDQALSAGGVPLPAGDYRLEGYYIGLDPVASAPLSVR